MAGLALFFAGADADSAPTWAYAALSSGSLAAFLGFVLATASAIRGRRGAVLAAGCLLLAIVGAVFLAGSIVAGLE